MNLKHYMCFLYAVHVLGLSLTLLLSTEHLLGLPDTIAYHPKSELPSLNSNGPDEEVNKRPVAV